MDTHTGPGGPTPTAAGGEEGDEGFAHLAAYSPEAARNVLVDLTTQLRQHDLALASSWSEDVEALLD